MSNPGRLLVLGILDAGPMHGHRIKRIVEVANVKDWGAVQPGALYGMLHRLEREGLIEAVRSEQAGRRPPRTVYAITADGRIELHRLREAVLTDIGLSAATIDVAITFAHGDDARELRELLGVRRNRLELLRDELIAHRQRDLEHHRLPPAAALTFRHAELRVEAELRWHDEVEASLDEVVAQVRPNRWLPPEQGGDVVDLAPRQRTRKTA